MTLATAQLILRGRELIGAFAAIGRLGLIASLILSAGTLFFVLAIRYTTVANTLIILGLSPLWGAVLSRLFLRESIPPRTWVAIPLALCGIVLTVAADYGGVNRGDVFAFLGSVCSGAYMTLVRAMRHVDMTPSVILGSGFLAAAVLPLSAPAAIELQDAALLAVMGVVVMPISFVFFVTAPRYILAPEVSLIFLLEMVIGPYLVWLAMGEQPGSLVLLGGGVVLATLAGHTVIALRESMGQRS